MRNFLLISLFIISFSAQAQLNFYVEASGNHALISNSEAKSVSEISSPTPNLKAFRETTYKAEYTNKLGGGLGVGMNYFFKENLSFDAGLDLSNVNFVQKTKTSSFEYYQPIESRGAPALPTLPDTEHRDVYSQFRLSLPISLSYYLLENNLAVAIGAMPGILLYNSGGTGASADFNKAHIGIQVQLRYQLLPKLWLSGGFQEYSTKLYKPELKQSFSNLKLIKLGLKYDI